MGEASEHLFICCDRGDQLAWLEACWLAEQAVEIWCEDGVNPGTPDWGECSAAIQSASARLFMVTRHFARSIDALNKLRFAIGCPGPSVALLLEPVELNGELADLLRQCVTIDKTDLSPAAYRQQLGTHINLALEGSPQVAESLSPQQSSGYSLGDWRVYPQLLRIESASEAKTLDRKLVEVLTLLVDSAPDVVSIELFLEKVWRGTFISDNSVHRAISRLRKALKDDPKSPQYIETISKSGYRLLCPVVRNETLVQDVAVSAGSAPCYLQLMNLEAVGDAGGSGFAAALSVDLQSQLCRVPSFYVLPREERLHEPQRRARYLIGGQVQALGGQARVSLEVDDLLDNRVVWTASRDVPLPDSLAEQSDVCAQLGREVVSALHGLER